MSEPKTTPEATDIAGRDDLERALDEAAETVRVQAGVLGELESDGSRGEPIGLEGLMDVPVKITVQIGRTRLRLAELVELGPGSIVALDREAHEPADILVNGKVVARGEVVTVGERYGVRISEVLSG